MNQMPQVHDTRMPAPSADLDVYRLSIQGKTMHLLYRTLSDQIRPDEDKLSMIRAGGGLLSLNAILSEEEVTFVKLRHPEVQVDWIYCWDAQNVKFFGGAFIVD